jgi:pyruvate formate lyase activating enzyme
MKSRDTGLVFDVHRFSLYDGPGIRTTVFLKGCPLHCDWCHNPESQTYKPQLSFNPDKCINCFDCVDACPNEVHRNVNGKHEVIWDSCQTSGECVKACSYGALKLIGSEYNIREIINEVLKDKNYYEKTGGGLTISGGEPLAQFEFTKALLEEAKKEGIHTCIDTCGLVSEEKFKAILPYTDLFLFDYKVSDEQDHKQYTGSGNRLILSNLDFLIRNGASVILRCPLVPGINDNTNHLKTISELAEKYPRLKGVEIMPYHSMGRDKAGYIGKEYKFKNLPDASEEQKTEWTDYYKLAGLSEPFLSINK